VILLPIRAGTVAEQYSRQSASEGWSCVHQIEISLFLPFYGDIYFRAERPKPFAALDPSAHTIYCSSFSKTIPPGYRVGWLASRRHVESVLEYKLASTLSSAALPQAALADFLSSGGYDSHLRRIRRTFAGNIDQMTRVIARSFPPGTRVSRPSGGFVLWVELPQPGDSRALLDEALKHGACFAPGDMFSATGRHPHCLRLSCGHGWDRRIVRGSLGPLTPRRRCAP